MIIPQFAYTVKELREELVDYPDDALVSVYSVAENIDAYIYKIVELADETEVAFYINTIERLK
jgi:hypothetical protein